MKNLIIVIGIILISGCEYLHSGVSIVKSIQQRPDEVSCVYETYYDHNAFSHNFIDSCNKHKIGDTIYIKSKN